MCKVERVKKSVSLLALRASLSSAVSLSVSPSAASALYFSLSITLLISPSLPPSLRPLSGCSNELINHGCWCLAGLAVTKKVANKLLWRKREGKGKKKTLGKVLHAKGNSVTDHDKKLQCHFFSFSRLMAQRQAVCSRPFPSAVDRFIRGSRIWISKFPHFYIINIALWLKGTESSCNERFIRARS